MYTGIQSNVLERTHLAIWDNAERQEIKRDSTLVLFVILHRHHVNIRPRHKTFSA